MRQRLSSEPDRYRGRRRVPTPPRSRYAAVVTTAFVGAGIVAFGAAGGMPDAKKVNPSTLAELEQAAIIEAAADRAAAAEDTTSRDADRGEPELSFDEADIWGLPLKDDYTFITPYGLRGDKLHGGIDLAAPEGTPYHAIHAGTVVKAGWCGGYGYCVILQHANGIESIYGHSSQLLVSEGQEVKAGDVLGLVGNTGHAYGSQLHLEVHVKGQPTDPIPFLRQREVDIKFKTEPIYVGLRNS